MSSTLSPHSSIHQSIINIDDIKTALEKHKNTVFKIHYTKKDLECIVKIDISKGKVYSHFGDIADCNPEKFFKEIGNNNDSKNIETLCKIISKLAKAVCKGYETKHAWLIFELQNLITIMIFHDGIWMVIFLWILQKTENKSNLNLLLFYVGMEL